MSKFNHVQTNFNNGEISDRSLGRIDSKEYSNSCRLVENFIPIPSGGMTKRPGTQFFKELDIKGGDSSIYPFISSKNKRYIILLESASASPLTAGNLRIINETGTVVLDMFWPLPNARAGSFTFVNIGDVLFFAHNSGSQIPFSIYLADSILETFTVQIILIPFGDPSVPQLNSFLRVPYMDRNITSLNFTFSGTTGTITVTASAAIFHVDMEEETFFRVVHGATEGVFSVTTVTSSTVATCQVVSNLGAATASTNWAESAWSGHRGWPRTLTYFEQRLFYASTFTEASKLWGSRSGNGIQFLEERLLQDKGSATDVSGNFYFGDIDPKDPFGYRLSSIKSHIIKWLNSSRVLNIGTNNGEYVATGNDQTLSNTSVSVTKQTSYGGNSFKTETIGDEVVYFTRDGRRVRSFGFSINNGSNISLDLTILADHMYRGNAANVQDKFRDGMYSSSRDCLWVLTEDGSLLGMTYSKEIALLAWHRHKLSSGTVEQPVISFAVLETDELDRLYIQTNRGGKRVIEFLGDDFLYPSLGLDFSETFSNPVTFLDASLSITFAGSTLVLPQTYFRSTTVTVTKNGFVIGDFPVDAAGNIDISPHVGIVNVDIFTFGYIFTASLETVDIEAGGDFGFSEGAIQRIDRVTAKVFKTFDLDIGVNEGHIDPVNMGTNAFTGSKRINLPQSPDTTVRVKIESKRPYPCTILSLAMRGVSYD